MPDSDKCMEYIINIIYIVTAVIGWIVAHYFTSCRDRDNKRRDLRTKYLIEAYEILCCEITQRPMSDERAKHIEDMIAKIQLVGDERQIELTHKLSDDICHNKEFCLDELINDLRNDLRSNLGLPKIKKNVHWLRMTKDQL